MTNDLPHFDGAYHLVVSHGGRSTAASAPGTGVMTTGPNLYRPTQVGAPYTVTISPAGAVSVTPGLVAVTAGGVISQEQAALDPPPNPPTLANLPSSAPVVTSVSLLPDPAKLDLPPDVDMLLAANQHLTMTVRARSPERVPLFCQWEATDGGLSSPEQVRATYLHHTQEWESVWQWRFPAQADPGTRITLKGVVRDAYGNEAPIGLGVGADPFVVKAGELNRIVFTTTRDGNWEVNVMNADGTGQTRLTDHPEYDGVATWSPDGSRIVFYSRRDGNWELYLMNSDGSGQTRLTNTVETEAEVEWSPDGCRIAFQSDRDGNNEVYVMNADGSGQINLTNHPGEDTMPAWSPDGSRIAFLSNRDGNNEVYVMNANGSGPTNLSNNGGINSSPIWSPDGSRIAFQSELYDGTAGVWVMSPDGSGQTALTNSPSPDDSVPAWSPDGSRIAFQSFRDGNWEVYVMNSDGTGQTNLSNHSGDDAVVSGRWSPDGGRIVVSGRIICGRTRQIGRAF